MKPYKVWFGTSIGTSEVFLIWANCMDDAIANAKRQIPSNVRIHWTGAQRAD